MNTISSLQVVRKLLLSHPCVWWEIKNNLNRSHLPQELIIQTTSPTHTRCQSATVDLGEEIRERHQRRCSGSVHFVGNRVWEGIKATRKSALHLTSIILFRNQVANHHSP